MQHLTITSETGQHILTATCPEYHTDEKHCSLLWASIHKPFQAHHAHASTSSHMVSCFVHLFKCRPLLSEPATFHQQFHCMVSSRTPFLVSLTISFWERSPVGLLQVRVPLARHAVFQKETSFTSEAAFLCPTLVSNMSAFFCTTGRAFSSSVFESAHSFNFVSYVLLDFDKSATCLCQCTPVLASKRFSFFALVSLSRNLLVLPLQNFLCFLECVEPRAFPIVSSLTGLDRHYVAPHCRLHSVHVAVQEEWARLASRRRSSRGWALETS